MNHVDHIVKPLKYQKFRDLNLICIESIWKKDIQVVCKVSCICDSPFLLKVALFQGYISQPVSQNFDTCIANLLQMLSFLCSLYSDSNPRHFSIFHFSCLPLKTCIFPCLFSHCLWEWKKRPQKWGSGFQTCFPENLEASQRQLLSCRWRRNTGSVRALRIPIHSQDSRFPNSI